jgi:hypothetical protein
MATFTVLEPPPKRSEDSASPVRYAFVRDGFYFWALVFGPFWMLYHRMWLVFLMYVIGTTGVQAALWALGASALTKFIVNVLIALLIAMEAGTLRRWSLRRWTDRGIVVAYNREAAEHRFFDRWSGEPAFYAPPPATPPRPPHAASHVPAAGQDIVGLFPQPQSRP